MERRQERSCGLAGHVGGGKGGMGGLSLWAHMIGSLISAQLGPSNATDQQTGCQQTQSSFAQSVIRFFFWWTSPPFQRAHVLPAGEARRGSALWSQWCECRWWPRLCSVTKHTAQSTASGLGKMCARQNKADRIRMEENKWEGSISCSKAPRSAVLLLTDRWHFQSHWRGTIQEREAKEAIKTNHIPEDGLRAHWESVSSGHLPCQTQTRPRKPVPACLIQVFLWEILHQGGVVLFSSWRLLSICLHASVKTNLGRNLFASLIILIMMLQEPIQTAEMIPNQIWWSTKNPQKQTNMRKWENNNIIIPTTKATIIHILATVIIRCNQEGLDKALTFQCTDYQKLPTRAGQVWWGGGLGSLRKTCLMEESCSSSENHPTTVNLFRESRAMALHRLCCSTTAKADL